jgi:predicted GNAT family acetyltransferase
LTKTVLDNVGWHALNSHHAHFAIGSGLAKRYPPDMVPLAAVADYSDTAIRDLESIVAPGEIIGMLEAQPPAEIPGWTALQSFSVMQMVCDQPVPETASSVDILTMTTADVPDMLNLIELAQPGPFFPRTIEMGTYLGVRQQGQLVAMAGERFYPPGYREISAVCTHPDHVRKGYARLLVSRLVNQNWQHGDVPFLHVISQNAGAIRLYESLHFHVRGEQYGIVLRR